MSGSRLRAVVQAELRFHFTTPMVFILTVLLLLIAWQLSTGNLTISSGDSTIGGESKAHITSEFAVGMMFPIVTFLFYSFFIAVAAGMAVPQDDEIGVSPVLHATRLTPAEYVWGKFLGVLLLFLVVLGLHLLFTIFFNQILPHPQAELIRGPFSLVNYLRPAVVLALPFIVFLSGASLAVGELTRRPILIFVTPLVFFLVSIFFLWEWSPAWLPPAVNDLLGWIEPSGYRWLTETWLKVDLGVAYYNHQPIGYDVPFLLSRLVYTLLGIGLVAVAARHCAGVVRGREGASGKRRAAAAPAAAGAVDAADAVLRERPLAALQMSSRTPGFLRTCFDVARYEAHNLRSQPGLYIFAPLILLQTIGNSVYRVGAFDTPLLVTPGIAAVGAMDTLTLLLVLLLLLYTAESLHREEETRLAPIFRSTPAGTGAILLGKAVANGVVGAAILFAAYVGAAGVMLVQGEVAPAVGPFFLVWGLLLVPTLLLWAAFVTTVLALTRSRFTTYGVGLAALAFTGWLQSRGHMSWVGNWDLWSTATWSDFAGLDPNRYAFFLNRLFWLSVMALLIALAVRLYPRRDPDSGRLLERLQPVPLLRQAWRLTPLLIPAVVLGALLWVEVTQGFQGGAASRREEEYRGRNLLTWADAEPPRIAGADVDLTLDPDAHAFAVTGSYRLVNRTGEPMRRFPMSVGDHFENVRWTLDGEPFTPEHWARLYVFNLAEPLPPDGAVEVGFAHEGKLPDGITKNGGGMSQFILPSGVVLTSIASSFLPVPFFELERGVDKDNRLEPKVYADRFWEGLTPPAYGAGSRYPVRTRITGPARFDYHGVGVRVADEVKDGQRTVVWETDHPVNFFNVVAGEWSEWQGDGVAIYHHPRHTYNLEEMAKALQAARDNFSRWFYPYPWRELKLNEFPGIANYAQGFPTNITFSENIGFLTRSTPEAQAAFLITAHEAAHQWWGNILLPGRGPGGEILSEGTAHFSSILLTEEVLGLHERIELCKNLEDRYGDRRRVDSEKPLVWVDGSKDSDATLMYDKGGWVFWMLLNHLGREQMLAGIHDFIGRYAESDDFPVLQDFVEVLREYATDVDAYDAFTRQWFFEVVVPEYHFAGGVDLRPDGAGWIAEATLENAGTGRMPVEVAAVRGERFPEEGKEGGYQEARAEVVLGAGESRKVRIRTDFVPERLVVDPDATVLMLKRKNAARAVAAK